MPPSQASSTPITRRRLAALTAAGGSAFVLAACGTDSDPDADKSDAELAQAMAVDQMAVSAAYAKASDADPAFKKQSDDLMQELIKASSGTTPSAATTAASDPEQAENDLIATTNAAVADIDSDTLRQLAYRVSAASAGRLAALNDAAGKNPAPTAFVLGTVQSA